MGEEYFRKKEFEESLNYHKGCLNLKIKMKQGEESLIKSYLIMGFINSKNNNKKNAKDLYLNAEALTQQLGPANKIAADVFFHLGDIYDDLSEFTESEKYHEKSLKIRLENQDIGKDHFLTAGSYCQLGKVQRKLNKLTMAIKSLNDAKEIYDRIYSDNYPQICDINIEIGKTLSMQSYFFDAIKYFNQAEMKLRLFNPESCELANVYSHLGSVYSNINDLKNSEIYHEKALKIYIMKEGENHITSASCYNNLGLIHKKKLEFVEANKKLLKAYKIFEEQKTYQHLKASCLMNIGVNYASSGDSNNAELYLNKAKVIGESMNKDTIELSDIYFNLACIKQCIPSTYDEAIVYLNKCLSIREKIYGKDNHFDIASIHENFGLICFNKYLCDNKTKEENLISADNSFHKVLKIYEKLYSNINIFSAEICLKIGNLFADKKVYPNAIVFLEKAVNLNYQIFNNIKKGEFEILSTSKQQENLAFAYLYLGNAYFSMENNDQLAKQSFESALENFIKIGGEASIQTTICNNCLANVCKRQENRNN